MWRIALLVALVIASTASFALDSEQHNRLYRKGIDLVRPYTMLSDGTAADPTTEEAREHLTEGIALLREVVRINPQNHAAYWIMGMGYRSLGNAQEATTAFASAYELHPLQPDYAREYSYSCMCSGQTAKAVEVARRVSDDHPQDAGLLANLGLALLAHGELEEAEDVTTRAFALTPSDPVTGRLLREIGDVKEGKPLRRFCR